MSESRLATVTGLRRVLYVVAAGGCFALGMIGVVLPGLPTTPFLLLTSYLLIRSWPSLNARMLRSRLVGSLLRDWHEHRGIRPHLKARSVALIVIVLSLSIWLAQLPLAGSAAIAACGLVGIVVVLRLPTIDA